MPAAETAPRVTETSSGAPAGFWRRIASMFYDALLLLALYMFTAALLLPFTRGEAITPQDSAGLTYLLRGLLLAATFLYFGLSWTRRGQTVGMIAWSIRAQRADGTRLGWRDAAVRLIASLLSWLPAGLGFLWMVIDRRKLAWHDRLSGTRIVRIA
jgi:uncharacterized RDD family membrane protein YckC